MSEKLGPEKEQKRDLFRIFAAPSRWFDRLSPNARGALLVSCGSIMLVVMGVVTKYLGSRLPAFELQFFRSLIGFLFLLPLFIRDPLEPFRTKRPGTHLLRGMLGSAGNFCFFWTITSMLLADSMALQFSRPLWTIPLAILLLGEAVGARRLAVSLVGFAGVWMYARPFTEGFDPNALIGAAGGLFAALVIITVKRLSSTEPTRVIMFYYAFYNVVFAALPAWYVWVTPTFSEWPLLILIGFLGIAGQGMVTRGVHYGEASVLAPFDYTRVVYAAVFGYLIFGEIPGLWSFAGMALIIASSIYLVLSEKKKPA
jgi:drug/metabolite transporter (DMT)-like permease